MSHSTVHLDAETLARIQSLELEARRIVEGLLAGSHRSAQHGFAVEFAQHREYAPGDDIRHVDWKVFGRSERFYLKQYELETNLVAWMVVDASESMHYGSSARSKYDLACQAAAALAYLILRQSDAVGLATFDARLRQLIPPSSQPSHLKELLALLAQGCQREKTNTGATLHELAERIRRRGLVVLLSDCFDDVPDLLSGLKHLRYRQHEVIVLHTIDAAEEDFPFRDATLFRGLEGEPELLTDPYGVRQGYLEEFRRFVEQLRRGCRDLQIDYLPLRTDADLGRVLASYLAQRQGRH